MLATPPRPSNNKAPSSSPTSISEHPSNFQHDENMAHPRSCILIVGERAGRLCGLANSHLPMVASGKDATKNDVPEDKKEELAACMSELLQALLDTATSLNLDIIRSIHNKMALNAKKYPVELCKGKAGKYTQYSNQTGITKDNQSTEQEDSIPHTPISVPEMAKALPALTSEIAAFARARQWDQFHTPRNLVLAMLGEVGELAELVQWMGDVPADFSSKELDKLSQELADVSIYMLRIATECKVVDEIQQGLLDLNKHARHDHEQS
ncbi:MAG: hypothetical protein SGBAC_008143 [Bacillariaceae sp.]